MGIRSESENRSERANLARLFIAALEALISDVLSV